MAKSPLGTKLTQSAFQNYPNLPVKDLLFEKTYGNSFWEQSASNRRNPQDSESFKDLLESNANHEILMGTMLENNGHTDEQRLLYFLLRNYEKAVRPVRNASHAVVVKLGMTLTNIFDVDEKNQVLTLNIWLDQEWKDELLVWDPKDFNGITSLRVPCDLLWLPEIVLYNSADDYTNGYMRSRAMIFYDGTVFWPPPIRLRSTCKISVTYFPFDSQHCSLKFGSWTYHGFQVDITNRSLNVDLSNYVESGEFDLISVYQQRRVVKYTCCNEPYIDLTFYIHIRRKTLYYLNNVVLPCLMMSILTLLVFFLPPDSGEKIALGITVLLAFSVFVLAIAEKMPETSDSVPLIGIYLTSVMAITSISVIMTVMVLNIHHRGPFNKPVPDWVKRLVLGRIRSILHMRMPLAGFQNVIGNGIVSIGNGMLKGVNIHTDLIDALRCYTGGIKQSASTVGQYCRILENSNEDNTRDSSESTETSFYQNEHGTEVRQGTLTKSNPTNSSKSKKRRDILEEKLMNTLKRLTKRLQKEDRLQLMANEWRQVAQIIDRLFFWVFLIATVILTVMLLIVIPFFHRMAESSHFDETLYTN